MCYYSEFDTNGAGLMVELERDYFILCFGSCDKCRHAFFMQTYRYLLFVILLYIFLLMSERVINFHMKYTTGNWL